MKDIEIPLQNEKTKAYRWLERLPAILSWSLLALPFVLSQISPLLTTAFILGYLLMWFARAVGLNVRVIQGYRTMKQHEKLDWTAMIKDIEHPTENLARAPSWHARNIARLKESPAAIKPSDTIHVMMIAAYNEGREVLEPTIKSVISSDYNMKKVIVVMAYEGRDGAQSEEAVLDLVEAYKGEFMEMFAVKHPLTQGEVRGKGGNITYAARVLQKRLEEQGIDPLRVLVTTLDSDNRPHKNYIAALTYTFCLCPDPKLVSFSQFQCIPITFGTRRP